MRKLIIGLVLVVLLVVGGLVLAFVNINALLEENRGRLAQIASDAVGREVQFEKAEIAFSGGLAIRVDGLRVAEDPRYGEADFLALDSAFVGVEIWPALQRRLELSRIRLESPTIRVIQTARGFNFSSLGATEEAAPPPSETGEGGPPMAIAIAAFDIRDGTVLYEDRTAKPPRALTIESFKSTGTDLSLEGPIDIEFSGNIRPTKGDATLASRVSGRIELEDLETQAGRLVVRSPTFHPLLLGVELEEDGVRERLDDLRIDIGLPASDDPSGYPISVESSAGRLAGFDYQRLDARLRYRGSTAEIKRVAVELAGGKVDLAGNVTFGPPGRSPFDLALGLENLAVNELAAVLLGISRDMLSGRIKGDIDVAGDSLEWERLKRSLTGRIALEMDEAALEKVNLLDTLVGKLVADPGLGQLVATSIRDVAPSALQGNRTAFKDVDLDFGIANGQLNADALKLMAGEFAILAGGTLGLDGRINGDGTIRFSEDLSKKILAKADRFAPLLADGNIVVLPLRFGGEVSSPTLRPDLAALTSGAREAVTQELQDKATKAVTDALFGKKKKPAEGEGTEGTEGTDAAADEEARQRESAEGLIKEGLGRLLGK